MERKCKDEIFVVGGGPSLKGFDFGLLKGRQTIVVNKSIFDVADPSFFITTDFTFLRKIDHNVFSNKRISKVFIACLNFSYMVENVGRIVDTRSNLVYQLNDFDVIIKSYKCDGIGYTFNDFRNGRNSGYCALQLAVLLGYKRIYLMGIDLCTVGAKQSVKTHYHNGYGEDQRSFSKKLVEYRRYFEIGLKQITQDTDIEVISLSQFSLLNKTIPHKNIKDVLG